MENLKKNLHYIVFASGIIIGAVLLFVGISIRGGKEEEIGTRVTRLKSQTAVRTDGELRAIDSARNAFDDAVEEVVKELTDGKGQALRRNLGAATDVQRFRTETDAFISTYKARFEALAKPVPLPERMRGWVYRRTTTTSTQGDAWDRMRNEVNANSDAQKISEFRRRQAILHEICVACEALIASRRFGSQGVALRDFNFENPGTSGSNLLESPWETMPFSLRLECSPEFALSLSAELSAPTAMTTGMAQDAALARRGFPIRLDGLQMMHLPRPLSLRFDISNEMKADLGIDPQLDPASEAGRTKQQEIAQKFDADLRPALPMDVGMRMRALMFNPAWRAVAEEPQQ